MKQADGSNTNLHGYQPVIHHNFLGQADRKRERTPENVIMGQRPQTSQVCPYSGFVLVAEALIDILIH